MACGSEKEKAEVAKKDMAPNSLQEIHNDLVDILDKVGIIEKLNLGMTIPSEEDEMEMKDIKGKDISDEDSDDDKNGDNDNNNNDEENDDKEVDASNADKDHKDKLNNKENNIEENWLDIDEKLEKVHSTWNEYAVEALEKGAINERINNFNSDLNKATNFIEKREVLDIYNYTSQAIGSLKYFYELYTEEIRGDIAQLQYQVYQYYIMAITGDLQAALASLSNNSEAINRVKLKIKDDEEKLKDIEKISLAINNLSQALQENSRQLFIIKKDIIIEDLKKLAQ